MSATTERVIVTEQQNSLLLLDHNYSGASNSNNAYIDIDMIADETEIDPVPIFINPPLGFANILNNQSRYNQEQEVEENEQEIEENEQKIEEDEQEVEKDERYENGTGRRSIKKTVPYQINNGARNSKKRRSRSSFTSKKRRNVRQNIQSKSVDKRAKDESDDEEEEIKYEVRQVIGKRTDRRRFGKSEYQVWWKGYARKEATWEPEENLREAYYAIMDFEKSKKDGGAVQTNKGGKAKDNQQKPEAAQPQRQLPTMRARGSSPIPNVPPLPKKDIHTAPKPASPPKGAKKRKASPYLPAAKSAFIHARLSSSVSSQSSRANSRCRSNTRFSWNPPLPPENQNPPTEILNVQRSQIEGCGPIATVRLQNGQEQRITTAQLKNNVPAMLVDFYEAELNLV